MPKPLAKCRLEIEDPYHACKLRTPQVYIEGVTYLIDP